MSEPTYTEPQMQMIEIAKNYGDLRKFYDDPSVVAVINLMSDAYQIGFNRALEIVSENKEDAA